MLYKLEQEEASGNLFKPVQKSEAELMEMTYNDREDYNSVLATYNNRLNYRRLLTAMYIESLVLDICYFQNRLKKFDEYALNDFYVKQLQKIETENV